MNWKQEMARYERHLKGTNRRPSNRASILGYLRALGERYKPKSFLDLEPEDISGFLGELREAGLRGTKGLAENTLKSILSRIRTFIRFLGRGKDEERRRQARNLLEAVEPRSLFAHPKITPRVRSPGDLLTPEDMERFLSVCDGEKRAIFLALWWSGCRPSEILRLKRKDVNFNTYEDGRPYAVLTIRNRKNDKDEDEFLAHPDAIEAVRKWVKVAPENPEGWIFPSPYEGPLKYQALWAYMKRKSAVVGLKKNVYPYLLRHGAGTRRYEAPPEIWKQLQGSNQRENYIHLADKQALDWVMEHEAGEKGPVLPENILERLSAMEKDMKLVHEVARRDEAFRAALEEIGVDLDAAREGSPMFKTSSGRDPLAGTMQAVDRAREKVRKFSEALEGVSD